MIKMLQLDNEFETIHHEVVTDDELQFIEMPVNYKQRKNRNNKQCEAPVELVIAIVPPEIHIVQPEIQVAQPEIHLTQSEIQSGPKTFRNMFQKNVLRSL